MIRIETTIYTDCKILKDQPKQNSTVCCKCMYAFSQNRHDRHIMTSFQNKNASGHFMKTENMENTSYSDISDEAYDKSLQLTAPRCKIKSDEKREEYNAGNMVSAIKQKAIISLQISTGIRQTIAVNDDKTGVIKRTTDVTEEKNSKRDWLKWKMCFQEKSRHTSHRKPTSINAIGLCLICMIICAMKVKTIQCNDVSLQVNTSPIVFGQTLDLQCNISNAANKCDINLRTWYGTKSDVVLCQNGNCINDTKYTERKNDDCSYSLLIANLSVNDINAYYTCSYGVSESKRGLMKSDFDFIKLPKSTSTTISIQESSDILKIIVQIHDVYPIPICKVTLKKRNLTGDVNITSMLDNINFNFELNILYNLTPENCGSDVNVLCLIEKLKVTDFKRKLNFCEKNYPVESTRHHTMMVAALIPLFVIVLAIFGLIVIVVTIFYSIHKHLIETLCKIQYGYFSTKEGKRKKSVGENENFI